MEPESAAQAVPERANTSTESTIIARRSVRPIDRRPRSGGSSPRPGAGGRGVRGGGDPGRRSRSRSRSARRVAGVTVPDVTVPGVAVPGVTVAGRGSRAAGAVVVGARPRPGLGRPLGGRRRPAHLDRRGRELGEVAAAQAGPAALGLPADRLALGDGGVDVHVGRSARTPGAAAGGRGAVAAGRIATGLFARGLAGLVVVHRPGLPPRAGPRAALDLVRRRPGVRSTPATGSVRGTRSLVTGVARPGRTSWIAD